MSYAKYAQLYRALTPRDLTVKRVPVCDSLFEKKEHNRKKKKLPSNALRVSHEDQCEKICNRNSKESGDDDEEECQ